MIFLTPLSFAKSLDVVSTRLRTDHFRGSSVVYNYHSFHLWEVGRVIFQSFSSQMLKCVHLINSSATLNIN